MKIFHTDKNTTQWKNSCYPENYNKFTETSVKEFSHELIEFRNPLNILKDVKIKK